MSQYLVVMKKQFLVLAFGLCVNLANAQNFVGINTTNPQASLDVRGSQRVGGSSNYMHYDSATGRIQWIGAALYVPVSQQIIRHSATSEGLYAGGGKLEYRNTTDPVFFSDLNGNGYFSGKLGIGVTSPYSPLTFNNTLGEKISLYGSATSSYGFAIQGGTLQIHSDASGADIAFGHRTNSSFTERMRIKGDGNVGVGVSDPSFRLDLSGRLRVRTGDDGAAGIFFNNATNTAVQAFVGLENDNYVGFYGAAGAGWKLAMNTQSGSLKINGTEGVAGQVVQSNGPGASAQWQWMANALPTYYVYNSIGGIVRTQVNSSAEFMVANSTITLTVPTSSRLVVSANYAAYGLCPDFGSCITRAKFYYKVDGVSTEPYAVCYLQGVSGFMTGSITNFFSDVTAGTHTITSYTKREGDGGEYHAYLGSATIIVLQQ